jgi:hypothetical protein
MVKKQLSIKKIGPFDKSSKLHRCPNQYFAQRWKLAVLPTQEIKKADIRIKRHRSYKVPYFDERYNLKSSFDSIRLNIQNIDKSGGELHIDGFTRSPTLG